MASAVVSSLSRNGCRRSVGILCGTSRQTTSLLLSAPRRSSPWIITNRTMVARTLPLQLSSSSDDLPYHIVMGMPALSPTMDAGSLAEWYVKEGDHFIAGASLAKIETDKASIDFEAQDDGYVAKLLVEAGGPDEVKVGTPILVTVEEEEDVAAFANFSPPAAEAAPVGAAPAPAAARASPPTPPPAPVVEETTPPPVIIQAAAAAATPPPPPPVQTPSSPAPSPAAGGWGSLALFHSPLVKTLSKQQKAYVEKYGRTGQVPL